MALTANCLYGRMVPGCRHLRIQEQAIAQRERVAHRLTVASQPGLNFADLANNNVTIIKGLFIPAVYGIDSCIRAKPLLLFGLPVITGMRADFQHLDLARKLGLARKEERDYYGFKQLEDCLAPGVWGFVLSPLLLSFPGHINSPRIDFSNDGTQTARLLLNPAEESRLAELGPAVWLEKLFAQAGEGLAASLLKENIPALILPEGTNGFWLARGSSGIGGNIPAEYLSSFAYALARHAAPDFSLFGVTKERFGSLTPGHEEIVHPNCLLWPPELRIIE